MDSSAFWDESGSVRVPVKFESCISTDEPISLKPCKEEQSLFQFCDGNLNFATVATSEDDEFSFNKKKLSRDPLSHRIIEKRRRDRMNNCLADLSRLIPADYLKKGRGRIEKTEIIEMAIKHMKHLQSRAQSSAECDVSDQAPPPEQLTPPPSGRPIHTEHYRLGYLECLSEAMHFMVEVEGFYAGDPLCVQLINHLQKHCDKILKGDRLNYPRAHGNETASSSSGSSGSYPQYNNNSDNVLSSSRSPNSGGSSSDDFRNDSTKDNRSSQMTDETYEENVVDLTRPSQLRDMLVSPDLVSHDQTISTPSDRTQSRSRQDTGCSAASLYKFKSTIKQRFSAEGDGSLKRRRFELPDESMQRHFDTCSTSSSPSPIPPEPSQSPTFLKAAHVPIFALHPKGSHYVPLTLNTSVLSPYFNDLNLLDDSDLSSLVLHPVTISVNFKHTTNLKVETRPSRLLSSVNYLWKNECHGFDPLPNWYHSRESQTISIPAFKKTE